ncbi:type II toxin-antitoxin system prevent-host-death family antitoxin [Brachybacterium sp. Marseille-Q7125]|uniref:type II toxin-antitoxin system Phd/YefM family antitoxin n=1 Tax=Brachybacterium sp. Marseille-Q7125 TaxID=2932815 RepID=UPI001FF6075F|nr:type II toxin-antitoxin system prevent-host-death family antitoxin [Brachybacterium sp. Marseille-Q7125]
MSTQVNIAEAKARLSELVSRAVRGEEITLARSGTAMARIVALEEPPRRELGRHPELAVDRALLLAPMDEDELAEWE